LVTESTVAPERSSADAGNGSSPSNDAGDGTLYCVNHPNVETLLRCNRCGRPICLKCAQLTDVGYRCKDCIRGVQASYFTAVPIDNWIALGVSLIVSAAAMPFVGLILGRIGFFGFFIAFMIGGAAGGVLAQIIRSAVGKRRGRYLRHFMIAGVIIGVLVGAFGGLVFFRISPFNLGSIIFAFLAATTAYQILR
jgi:MFS family permease